MGAGFNVATALRGRTSNRGIGWLNGWTPKSGLGGAPVGIPSAYTLLAKGLNPLIGSSSPPAVMTPHLIKSRREICPVEYAFTISRRLFRAFSASLSRALDAFGERYTLLIPFRAGARYRADDASARPRRQR
ncbi:MAG: hypothetical protein DMG00_22605 [Acidobacteria bacterium]|nr:MAG: hypothetical protein DMG00_22605 [Acidobacteriota bacterium]